MIIFKIFFAMILVTNDGYEQCDQMAIWFVQLWPVATNKICPNAPISKFNFFFLNTIKRLIRTRCFSTFLYAAAARIKCMLCESALNDRFAISGHTECGKTQRRATLNYYKGKGYQISNLLDPLKIVFAQKWPKMPKNVNRFARFIKSCFCPKMTNDFAKRK